jgi:hypothetical protein
MALACCRLRHCDDLVSFHSFRNIKRSNRDALAVELTIHGSIITARRPRFRRRRSGPWNGAGIAIRTSITNVSMLISAMISSRAFTGIMLSNGDTVQRRVTPTHLRVAVPSQCGPSHPNPRRQCRLPNGRMAARPRLE